jgi:hypothetical protein
VSSVQASTLSRSKQRSVWEGQRVVVTKGPFKGYHGLVKIQYEDGVDVELDAKLASSGQTRQRFLIKDVLIECLVECVMQYLLIYAWTNPFRRHTAMPVASSSRLNRTPPPEVMTRPLTPEPEETEEDARWSIARRPSESLGDRVDFSCVYSRKAWKHWLFAEELQEALGDECIPFHIRGVPSSSRHAKYEGLTAKTVVAAKRKISPEPNEVVMSVVQKRRPTQISIDPFFLVPWTPVEGNKVIIVGHRWIGQVGKLVKLEHGCCEVELAPSGVLSYFKAEDVVNILKK